MHYKACCLIALLLLFASCTQRSGQGDPPSSVAEETSAPTSKEDIPLPARMDAPPAELTVPGEINMYIQNLDSDIFTPRTVPVRDKAPDLLTLLDLVSAVEESARRLYGENVSLTHGDSGRYRYLDLLGVYTPPHMGGGQVVPIILGDEDLGDRLRGEVAYVVAGSGYMAPGTWEEIPENGLKEYVHTRSARYEVLVKKTGDNWFLFQSQRPVEQG